MKLVAMAMACGCTLTGAAALAQDAATPSPLVGALVTCKSIGDEGARVRCYDAAVDKLVDATAKGTVMVVDQEEVRNTRRSLFGFSLPRLPLFRGDTTAAEAPEEIEAKITSVRGLGYGKYVIELDSGGRWQTTEAARSTAADPRPGDLIRIRKGALGAYFLSIDGARAVKGMRIG